MVYGRVMRAANNKIARTTIHLQERIKLWPAARNVNLSFIMFKISDQISIDMGELWFELDRRSIAPGMRAFYDGSANSRNIEFGPHQNSFVFNDQC